MIKANELRIGNLLHDYKGMVINVSPKIFTDIESGGWKDAKYIPITEEWLIKFGFTKNRSVLYKEITTEQSISFSLKDTTIYAILEISSYSGQGDKYDSANMVINCNYVHQLQNLYFALTGEELILKTT
jgi:hypothetical protein